MTAEQQDDILNITTPDYDGTGQDPYGSLSLISGTTNTQGSCETTYTVGTVGGIIEFIATDEDVLIVQDQEEVNWYKGTLGQQPMMGCAPYQVKKKAPKKKILHVEKDYMSKQEGSDWRLLMPDIEAIKEAFNFKDTGIKKVEIADGSGATLPMFVEYLDDYPHGVFENPLDNFSLHNANFKNNTTDRTKWKKWHVHLIGAWARTRAGEFQEQGGSSKGDRWCYLYFKKIDLLYTYGTEAWNYATKVITVHEIGHQFGLWDHLLELCPETKYTDAQGNKLKCVMLDIGEVDKKQDFHFCNNCLKTIRNYVWE